MPCDYCERPEDLDRAAFVYLWPPQAHTRSRLRAALSAAKLTFREVGKENCLVVGRAPAAETIEQLSGCLSESEAADTRVLISDDDPPSLGAFAKVQMFSAAARQCRNRWVLDLIREERYRSWAQPIYTAASAGQRRRIGHEFLLRGLDERGNTVPPNVIFDAVTDPRTLFNVDRAARISAVKTAAALPEDDQIFINFMPGSVYDPNVCLRTTVAATEKYGISADRVVFEIVEDRRIADLGHLRKIVDFYRDAGFRIALDDYGSGHSNLEAFISLSPDFVKLDKSLTGELTGHDTRVDLVRSVVDLCHGEGISVVAEGIEFEENAEIVAALGVDYMQGFHLGRPAPVPARDDRPGATPPARADASA